jgi:hypothetical protein
VLRHDVVTEHDQLERLAALSLEHGVASPGVPSFLVCGSFIVGFDRPETTGTELRRRLGLDAPRLALAPDAVETKLFGQLRVSELGLPAFTLAVGLVDGFNPCAMWVLMFLLSLLVNLRSRRRILAIAGVFVVVSGAVYYAFMAAWLNVLLIVGLSRTLQIALGLVAVGIGGVHIKDFFAFGRGPTLGVPESAKPGIYARVRRVVQAEDMAGALVAVSLVALVVNLVELLCTAGLPALYTQILVLHELSRIEHHGYLLLYNLAYVADDALMLGIVVYTLERHKLQERHGRYLKLLSGFVISALGVLMLVAPERLH